ncbi:Spectrin alpha chain [Toxocara canis]|uniref:Spectrin alpha chain n=1 Tax=Toxocara canis TaxID=6265 RepID=A0A0B2UZF3_TOXCA|nr:Spectrin alpha chain [Toxocara canis]
MKNDIIDYFPNIDPFLLRKWEHAFVTFFDVNHNGVLEWEDFQLLIEVIKAMRGADSDVYRTADVALKEIWNRLIEETHIVSSDHAINERYEKVRHMADVRREKLNKAITVHQFIRDIDDEESWIKEKKLLVSSDDYGRDLTGVQNLRKKHRRLDNELASHEPQMQLVREKGLELLQSSDVCVPEIRQRMAALEESWDQIRNITGQRGKKPTLAQSKMCCYFRLIRTTRSHQSLKPQISLLNWIAMWQRTLNGEETLWQKHYLEYMFKLIDASGDKLIDLAEYMEVLSYYNIGRMEAVTCFDKIAKTPEGSQKMAINYSEFCSLWDEYFNSTDLNASGNYLLGYV